MGCRSSIDFDVVDAILTRIERDNFTNSPFTLHTSPFIHNVINIKENLSLLYIREERGLSEPRLMTRRKFLKFDCKKRTPQGTN